MKSGKRIDAAMVYAATLALLVSWGAAGGQSVSSTEQLAPGPGRELVMRACSSCHSTTTVIQHRDTAAGWANEVDTMVARGAMLSAAEESKVVAYLAQHYPSGTAPSAAPASAADGEAIAVRHHRPPRAADCTARPCALLEGRYTIAAKLANSPRGSRLALHESGSRRQPILSTHANQREERRAVEGSLDLGKQSRRAPDKS